MNNTTKRIIAAGFVLFLSIFPVALTHAEVLQEIVVKDGDTLWGVANFYLKDPQRWPEILKFNNLSSDPNVILPGMKIRVPILLIKENLRAAHLLYVLNDVRFRRKSQAEWKKAWVDMELFNEDGVRTLQMSQARVKFSSGEVLHLDENSLIILRPEKSREEIDLLSGGVRASQTKILASDTIVDPRIEPKSVMPDFKARIREDKTTLVEVYEGIVDVKAQGKTVTLTKGFGTEVKHRQAPSLPRALPPRPTMAVGAADAPVPGTNFTAATKVTARSLELNFRIPDIDDSTPQRGSGGKENRSQIVGQAISKYHLQIATSTTFVTLIVDEVNPIRDRVKVDFDKYRLEDGMYFYRFAYVDELGLEGQYCPHLEFVIDTTPPALLISSPQDEEEIDTDFIHVEGETEAGIILQVNDKTVKVDDTGRFSTAIIPLKGWNQVSIIAEDSTGNKTKKELSVNKVKVAHEKKVTVTPGKAKERSITLASIALGMLTAAVILGVLILIVQ